VPVERWPLIRPASRAASLPGHFSVPSLLLDLGPEL